MPPSDHNICEKVEVWFKYHPPSETEIACYEEIRQKARELAFAIVSLTPPSADQTAALRKLRECVATANMAIACKGI